MKKSILVVEDDEHLQYLYSEILQLEGFTVHTAGSGQDALRLFQENPSIGLVILDLSLSGDGSLSSQDLMKEFQKTPSSRKLPVLIISGWHDGAKIADDLGAQGFLKKPVDLDQFLTLSQKLMN